jgi:polyisoprenoid-binding protein YceI
MNMKSIPVALTLSLLATTAVAGSQSYDFKDPKGVNNAVFNLDAPLEAISGTASGISGTIQYDPNDPGSASGKIVVAADSLTVPNPTMRDHMLGGQWMDVEQFPEITFTAKKISGVKTSGNKVTADVTGDFMLRGQTKEITIPVSFTYLEGKLAARSNGQMEGDLLVVRSRFTITRSDFGINPGAPADKVAEEIELTLSLAGAAPKS